MNLRKLRGMNLRKQRGMTLIEIMIVLAIIGILGGLVALVIFLSCGPGGY